MRLQWHRGIAFLLASLLLEAAIALVLVLYPTKVLAEPVSASAIEIRNARMTPDAVRSLIERAAANWTNGNAKAFAALFASDGEFVIPGQHLVGTLAIEKVASEFAKSHAQVAIKIQRIVIDAQLAEHPKAVVEWQWEDVETNTGKRTQADDAIVVDFAVNGQIKRWREYIDSTTPQAD